MRDAEADAARLAAWTSCTRRWRARDLPVVAQAIAGLARSDDGARSPQLERLGAANPRELPSCARRPSKWARSLLEWLRNHTTAACADRRLAALAAHAPELPGGLCRWPPTTPARLRATACWPSPLRWAENMAQAAIKSVPLGQTPRPAHPGGAERRYSAGGRPRACATPPDDVQAFPPMLGDPDARSMKSNIPDCFRS
jgi:urease accessory protein